MDLPRILRAISLLVFALAGLGNAIAESVQNTTYLSGDKVTVGGPAVGEVTTSGPVIVSSGAQVDFQATTRVRLAPGFRAQAGAVFRSRIVAPIDQENPSAPSGLLAENITTGGFILRWNAPADNRAVVLYHVRCNGMDSGTAPEGADRHFIFAGLRAGSPYTVEVQAQDAQGNLSPWSQKLTVMTLAMDLTDSDGDGMPDVWEIQYHLDPTRAEDAGLDPDGDGLTNIAEYNLGKSPLAYDKGTSSLGNTVPAGWSSLVTAGKSTEAVGSTPGTLTVDKSGALTYSVPIWVTPGTAGMQPQLALNYSSQAGPGIAGYGWSIGGMSSISRGPQTRPVDGQIRGVSFSKDDRFYLDGQRLILVSGTYGADGSEYRTEIESFSRIVAYGATPGGTGPTWFRVWTKAGLIMEFGHNDDSRFRPYRLNGSTFQAQTEVLSWAISRVYDTVGNYMEFVYETDAAQGTQRLERIKYTGNEAQALKPYASVRFEYETRTDAAVAYTAGARIGSDKRLAAVKVCHGDDVVRSYSLGYTNRPITERSILTSITEKGMNGIARKPLTFDYTNPNAGWDEAGWAAGPPAPLGYWNGEKNLSRGAGFVDVNGDGRPDLVQYLYKGSTSDRHAWLNTAEGWVTAEGGHGKGDFRPPWPLAWDNGADQREDGGSRWIDFNGDGLVDFIISNDVDNEAWRNTGTGFVRDTTWDLPTRIANNQKSDFGRRMLDVNGDGLVDIVYNYVENGVKDAGAYLNNGHGWTWSSDYTPPLYLCAGGLGSQLFDVNGDGLPDQVMYTKATNELKGVALNTGSGWQLLTQGTAEFNRYIPPCRINGIYNGKSTPVGAELVDVNGDGLIDLVKRDQAEDVAYINTGAGWVEAAQYRSPHEIVNNWEGRGVSFLDVNNDGMPDLIKAWWDQNAQEATHLNTGHGWYFLSSDSYNMLRQMAQPHRFNTGTDFVDLNGDGAVDQVWNYENDASRGAAINRRVNPDRLKTVTNGFGVTATIEYKPLTDPTVYTKASDLEGITDTTKVANAISSQQVVAKVKHDDGLGGTYDMDYAYSGLRVNRDRGSLGFAMMQVTDSRSGIVSKTWFKQEYPMIGVPRASETRSSGGGVLSESIISYIDKALNSGKTHFVYASETIQRSYELDGTLVSESDTTASEYDDWGNAKKIEVDTLDGYTKVTESSFDNVMEAASTTGYSGWLLGRLTRTTVTATAPNTPEAIAAGGPESISQARVSSFDYYSGTGLLHHEIVEPDRTDDEANSTLTTEYEYDEFGNRSSATVSGGEMESRTTATKYDTEGRFPEKTTNALGQYETYVYDGALGVLKSTTGPNNLVTSWLYDGFGTKTQETRADNTVTQFRQKWAGGANPPARALFLIETESTGTAPAAVFYDRFGREIWSYGINGGGVDGNPRVVGTRTDYDDRGRVVRTSQPFYVGDTILAASETLAFDELDRPTSVATADDDAVGGRVYTAFEYAGLTTKVTNAKGQRTETTKNSQGQVVRVISNADALVGSEERGEVSYGYDPFGNLQTTWVRKSEKDYVSTTLRYDIRGRKTGMDDPDMGTWSYHYNAAGELRSQTDAKGQTVTMEYDKLGRLVTRTEPEGTTSWKYDTAEGAGVGKLAKVTAPGYSETYVYDGKSRVSSVTRTIQGVDFSVGQNYDNVTGRPTVTTYPTGFKVENVYNSLGFLKEVREAGGRTNFTGEVVSGQKFWQADSYARTGQVDGSVLGNGLTYDRVISPATGRVKAITSGIGTALVVQYYRYIYDGVGNVKTRDDSAVGRSESFEYDGLNRLTTHTIAAGAVISVSYDALGNITSKSDVGSYGYDSPRPHAVTSAGGASYGYDGNGNMTTGGGQTYGWTSYNQLKKITKGGLSTEFEFGASHERVVQKHSNGTTTIYVGSLFERVTSGGLVEDKHYIFTPLGRTAVRTVRNDASVETRYFHQDGLGSISAVTDEAGRVEKRYAFDAWGKRLKTVDIHAKAGGTVTRGYTDHEDLDDFGLVHMNGRVYDPALGRFLSADPYVGDTYDSQDYNRYSYLGNNPLGGTDPSGYFSLKDAVKIVAIVAIGIVTAGAAVYAAALASGMTGITFGGALAATLGVSSTYSLTLTGAIIAGGAGGFASGFAGSLLNGGSIGDAFKAGVIGGAIGAVTGGLTHGIGTASEANDWGWFETAAAHGVVEGAANEAVGGQFRHGFYAGFFSSAAEGPISTYVPNEAGYRMVASAVVGGTSSTLGGGKFANGAVSGAFVYMFNKAAHQAAQKSVAWVYVEADHPEIAAGDDASVAKDMREQSAWLKKDMQVDDRNTSLNPFKKSTNYLSDGDRFDAFVVKQGDNYATLRQQLKGYDRVYVLIHGTTQGTEQLFYFNGMKVNEAGLRRMIPNMTEQYGCRIVSGTTTSAKFYEKYIPITRDYLRN